MSVDFVQLCVESGMNLDLESGVSIFDLSKTTGPNSFGCSAAMVWRLLFWIPAADKYTSGVVFSAEVKCSSPNNAELHEV